MTEKIQVKCGTCGVLLSVPGAVAGKKIRCPSCGGIVDVPGGSNSSPGKPSAGQSEKTANPSKPGRPIEKPPTRRKPDDKHSGRRSRPTHSARPPIEDYDAPDDHDDYEAPADPVSDAYGYGAPALPPRQKKKNSAVSAASSTYNPYASEPVPLETRMSVVRSDDELTAGDIAICILCSNIGCIVGIVRICTGKSSSGLKMFLFSLCMSFFWGGLLNAFGVVFGIRR